MLLNTWHALHGHYLALRLSTSAQILLVDYQNCDATHALSWDSVVPRSKALLLKQSDDYESTAENGCSCCRKGAQYCLEGEFVVGGCLYSLQCTNMNESQLKS